MSITLRGAALLAEARRLNISGRSRMSADQLRAAIAAVSAPVPPAESINLGDLFGSMPPAWTPGESAACDPYGRTQVPQVPQVPQCPITGDDNCKSRDCELHYMDAPLRLAPWASRSGKHKRPGIRRRIGRRSI